MDNFNERYWNAKANLLNSHASLINYKMRYEILKDLTYLSDEEIEYYKEKVGWIKGFLDESCAQNNDKFESENNIEQIYFFDRDQDALDVIAHKVLKKYESPKISSKKTIKQTIEKLLNPNVTPKLTSEELTTIQVIEKIYFEYVELFNPHTKEKSSKKIYYTNLMEQWKTANEMASNISSQRSNMNNFYVSLMSVFVGGILFSDQLLKADRSAKTIMYIVIAIIGIIVGKTWMSQIDNYGRLNGVKYDVINKLEKELPANVMFYEYIQSERNVRKDKRKINFSEQEKRIAKLFTILVTVIPIALLLLTWKEELWMIISAMF